MPEVHEDCVEPPGNEDVEGQSAHEVMLQETGQCPWCGEEDD